MSDKWFRRHTFRRRIFSADAAGEASGSSSESESSRAGTGVGECAILSVGMISIASRISNDYKRYQMGYLYCGRKKYMCTSACHQGRYLLYSMLDGVQLLSLPRI